MDKLLKYNGVQEALKFLREDDERTLQEHLEMCQIPAPSYEEGEKAEYVRKKMVDAGLSDVHIDEVGNVLGTLFGAVLTGIINNGLNLLSVSGEYHPVVKGIIIIVAVAFNNYSIKFMQKSKENKKTLKTA